MHHEHTSAGDLMMAVYRCSGRWIIPAVVSILSVVFALLNCTLPEDPAINPENVSLSIIETDTSNEIVIGDSLKIKITIVLPDLVDSLQILSNDSVYLTLKTISNTVTVSVLPDTIGKFSFKVKGYCQRCVVKESLEEYCIVKYVPIIISADPQNIITTEDSTAEFSITASAKPSPSIQWFRDSLAITGETSQTLKILSVSAAMNGVTFRARLISCADTVWSKPAVLTVNPKGLLWDTALWDNAVWQ